ncbi:hypothetical protein [Priestia taiwanensis]|nr:hypothetical protein [Priestia taiwanensis]MBM7364654.1 hypothetical protein [Priestia taiwanensis]
MDRSNGLPKGPTTMENVARLITTNSFLSTFQFEEISLEKME